MQKYGQETPPKINVENISKVPIFMFSAKFDRITNVEDNKHYAAVIPSVKEHVVLDGDHFTFLIGKDMGWFDRVNTILDDFNPLKNDLAKLNSL